MDDNWKELAEKYQLEAEIYAIAYQDVLRPIQVISTMQAVLVQMESERLKYEAERGQNEKSKLSWDRIDILIKGLDLLSGIAEKNIAMKYQLKNKSLKLIDAEKQIEHLKKQLSWGIE